MKFLTIENKVLNEVDTSNYKKATWGCYNSQTNILTISGQEDEYINGQYPKNPIVTNFDLNTGHKEIILSTLVYDCLWNVATNQLLYSTGNTIFSFDQDSKRNTPLFKFTSVRYAPINPSLSPNNKKLAYLKFKSDTRKLQILDLETGINIDTKTSCNFYQWLNNDTIIYSVPDKIKTLNIDDLKTKQTPINLKYLYRQQGTDAIEFSDKIKKLDEKQQAWTQFKYPRIYNKRIYFVISAPSKIYSLNSVDMNFNNFRIEFVSNEAIEQFWLIGEDIIMEMNKVVDMKYNYYLLHKKTDGVEYPTDLRIVSNAYFSDDQISTRKYPTEQISTHGASS